VIIDNVNDFNALRVITKTQAENFVKSLDFPDNEIEKSNDFNIFSALVKENVSA